MGRSELDGARPDAAPDVASLLPMLRRIVFSRVQNQAAAMIPHEQYGLHNIARISSAAIASQISLSLM